MTPFIALECAKLAIGLVCVIAVVFACWHVKRKAEEIQ